MTIPLWIAFFGLIGVLVAVDLGVTTRRPRAISRAEALTSISLWGLAALAFSFVLAYVYQNFFEIHSQISFPVDRQRVDGNTAWLQFITAYALELALSLDNIAVLALLIRYFKVPRSLVPRLLLWSIVFSLSARWIAISVCGRLLAEYRWMPAVLGAVLALAMVRMLVMPTERTDFDRRWSVRLARRLVPVQGQQPDQRLFSRGSGRWRPTPMLMFVIAACALDLTYAADSIPALFAVTKDPFIAFTASAFAVLGLRSLYFAVVEVVARFRFLRIALVALLCFIAVRMFETSYLLRATEVTLGVIVGLMLAALSASAAWNRFRPPPRAAQPGPATPLEDLSEAVAATRRNLRKVFILIAGTFVIVLGIVIAPIPGPGPTILVPIGLALLATEFIWARRLLDRVKTGAIDVSGRADAIADRTGLWIVPAAIIAYWALAVGLLYALLGLSWQVIAVVAGGPFMPLAIWAVRYLHRRWIGPASPGDVPTDRTIAPTTIKDADPAPRGRR